MWIIVAEERSEGLVGGDGNRVDCGSVEESVDARRSSDPVGIIVVLVDYVRRVLIKRSEMRVPRKRPWLRRFPCSFNGLQHLLLLQSVASGGQFLHLHVHLYFFYS